MKASRTRSRIAVFVLACALVWPPVQHVLSRMLDFDPWSFFGWAMYAVPNLQLGVRAARLESVSALVSDVAGNGSALDWNSIDTRANEWLREYARARERWGRLLPPDDVAQRIFDLQPELPALLIRVRRWQIDLQTARVSPHDVDYRYTRPTG